MPVRLSPTMVVVLGSLLVFTMGAIMTKANGVTEIEIQWKADNPHKSGLASEPDSSLAITHSFRWRGLLGQLRLPAELELKWSKGTKDSFAIEQGQLILKPSDYQVRLFHNKGFRSTLDPMRLLSASRRADEASGLEIEGRLGPVSGRGLWLEEIDNVGDNGPLVLLDMSLSPVGRANQGSRYRYIYISHDSEWNWHFPQSGAYATRTSRQIHSLLGSWDLVPNARVSTQMAILAGLDARKTYHRDLQGFAVLSRGEGYWRSVNWLLDVYRTNPGFVLATGDTDSVGSGRQGVRARLTRSRHRDESLGLSIQYEMPVREVLHLPGEMPGYALHTEPYSEVGLTHRRRLGKFNYKLGLTWETGKEAQNPKVVCETNWLPWGLRIGGRWGGTSTSQLYGRLPLHRLAVAEARYDLTKGWWRTAIKVQGLESRISRNSRWQGEAVYKKRPGEAYTYLALQHKMEKGYWEISWGKADRGRLDWSWGAGPELSLRVGRYF
jgi:hypothetical protein